MAAARAVRAASALPDSIAAVNSALSALQRSWAVNVKSEPIFDGILRLSGDVERLVAAWCKKHGFGLITRTLKKKKRDGDKFSTVYL